MNTTAGSKVLETNKARSNATVVQKLIDQGAIVLAKTNMSDWPPPTVGWDIVPMEARLRIRTI